MSDNAVAVSYTKAEELFKSVFGYGSSFDLGPCGEPEIVFGRPMQPRLDLPLWQVLKDAGITEGDLYYAASGEIWFANRADCDAEAKARNDRIGLEEREALTIAMHSMGMGRR